MLKKLLVVVLVSFVLAGSVINITSADDTLSSNLSTLFRGMTSNQIDDAVAQAKNQLTAEQKQSEQNDLEKLFDSQIATLKDRGVSEKILEELQNKKNAVISRASEITISEGNIPFIPVIKPNYSYLDYHILMSLVRNGTNRGYVFFLNPALIIDKVETPDGLYYIYDIEDGGSKRGKSPENAEKIFRQQKRSPLTAAEAIALTTHTNVLSRHFVDASGSRYDSVYVPFLWLDDGRPELNWEEGEGGGGNFSNARWGSASCGSR